MSTTPCPAEDPSSEELWKYVKTEKVYYAIYIISTILTGIMLIVFIEATVYIFRKVPHGDRAASIVWILGVYPIFGCTSLLGLYFPKAVVLCNLTASLYFSVCLYQFWILMMCYFGDEGKAYVKTAGKEIRLLLFSPRPKITMDENTFHLVKIAVLQVATCQPAILLIEDILWLNGMYNTSEISVGDAFIYLNTVSFLSNVIAMIALVVMYQVSREPLKPYFITQKFIIILTGLAVANIQVLVLHILVVSGVIPCTPPFKSETRANRLQSLILVFESILMFPVVLFYFRKREGNIVGVLNNRDHTKNLPLDRVRGRARTGSSSSLYNTYAQI